MIRLYREELSRLLCAPQDVEVGEIPDIIDTDFEPKLPWVSLGVGSPEPLLTMRQTLYVLVMRVGGQWSTLHSLGSTPFSLAILYAKSNSLVVGVGPATVDHLEVQINDDGYSGRIDFQLLADMRELRMTL